MNIIKSNYLHFRNVLQTFVTSGMVYDFLKFKHLVNSEQIQKALKYCKYAGSELNFDNMQSAIENLTRRLHLLQTGKVMAK